ncbi:hypothetical protein vBValMR11Z_374 [Vibrio phage vB_ValM_R11Z]|nr:hypothetical protein vBValMR11Z_374 [Vibrio phage vB_ValM_R11Z]
MKHLGEIKVAAAELLKDGDILTDMYGYTCNEIAFIVRSKFNTEPLVSFTIYSAVKNTLSKIAAPFVKRVYDNAVQGKINLSEFAMSKLKACLNVDYYRGTFIHDIAIQDNGKVDLELFTEYRRQWLEFILTQPSEHENQRKV